MNIYGNYKSPLGYQSGENYIDSYGVDHSGFSTRDEIEYQMARLAKENQIMQNFNKLKSCKILTNAGLQKIIRNMGLIFGVILIITMASAAQEFTTILRSRIIIHLKIR